MLRWVMPQRDRPSLLACRAPNAIAICRSPSHTELRQMGLSGAWDGQGSEGCVFQIFGQEIVRRPSERHCLRHRGLGSHVAGYGGPQFEPFCGWNRSILPMQCIGKMSEATELTVCWQELCSSLLPNCRILGCWRRRWQAPGGVGRDPFRMRWVPAGQPPPANGGGRV